MARVPASWLNNYVKKHGSAKLTHTSPSKTEPQTNTQAPAAAPTHTPTPTAPRPRPHAKPRSGARVPRKVKKKHGFIRKLVGAVAGEVLKGSGHVGRHIVRSISEDGMGGVGGTPVNNAGSGAVAGLGTSKDGPQGEPGVKKKKKAPMLSYKLFNRVKP